MREILFRGKRVDNGEWVQGYPCRYGWIGKEKDYIIPDYASALYTAEIDPETVGQYTGLTDTNGNKIFEGDIVWDSCDEDYGKVEWYNDMAKFIITYSTFTVDFDNVYGEELQIDGNVYDNPELIKGETIMNINLLQETVETLEQNGKSPADVEWVGIKNDSYYTWEEFEEQAKCVEYDADYSFEEIDGRLVVVGKDFWLERYEYDGSEWWEFKTLPTKPILKVDKLPILNEW